MADDEKRLTKYWRVLKDLHHSGFFVVAGIGAIPIVLASLFMDLMAAFVMAIFYFAIILFLLICLPAKRSYGS